MPLGAIVIRPVYVGIAHIVRVVIVHGGEESLEGLGFRRCQKIRHYAGRWFNEDGQTGQPGNDEDRKKIVKGKIKGRVRKVLMAKALVK